MRDLVCVNPGPVDGPQGAAQGALQADRLVELASCAFDGPLGIVTVTSVLALSSKETCVKTKAFGKATLGQTIVGRTAGKDFALVAVIGRYRQSRTQAVSFSCSCQVGAFRGSHAQPVSVDQAVYQPYRMVALLLYLLDAAVIKVSQIAPCLDGLEPDCGIVL